MRLTVPRHKIKYVNIIKIKLLNKKTCFKYYFKFARVRVSVKFTDPKVVNQRDGNLEIFKANKTKFLTPTIFY